MSKKSDQRAAEKLQTIFADIVQRPLTPAEIARTHQHVATVNAMFDDDEIDDLLQWVHGTLQALIEQPDLAQTSHAKEFFTEMKKQRDG